MIGCGLVVLRLDQCALCEIQFHRQNTACNRTRSYSPDDGHNDARNMLR